jgi:hypothetical protein
VVTVLFADLVGFMSRSEQRDSNGSHLTRSSTHSSRFAPLRIFSGAFRSPAE